MAAWNKLLDGAGPQDFLHEFDEEKVGDGQGDKDVFQHLDLGRGESGEAGKRRQGPFEHLHRHGIDEHRADQGQADEVDGEVAPFQLLLIQKHASVR